MFGGGLEEAGLWGDPPKQYKLSPNKILAIKQRKALHWLRAAEEEGRLRPQAGGSSAVAQDLADSAVATAGHVCWPTER